MFLQICKYFSTPSLDCNQELMRRRNEPDEIKIDFEKEREKHLRDIDLKEVC